MAREAAKHFIQRQRGNIVNHFRSTAGFDAAHSQRPRAYIHQQVRALGAMSGVLARGIAQT